MIPLFEMLDVPLRVVAGFTGRGAKGKAIRASLCSVVDHGRMRQDPFEASDDSEPDDNRGAFDYLDD